VIHHVHLQILNSGKCCITARVSAGEARRRIGVLPCNMFLEMSLLCKSCATVLANERSLAQVNFVHMTNQMVVMSEELPTGGTLERLLPKVDCLVVALHIALLAEDLATQRVCAWKILLTQMHLAIVQHHLRHACKWFAASGAWNLASHKLLLVANRYPYTLILATALEVDVQELLLGEGSVAGGTRNGSSLVVLGPGVSVEGAWIDAQFCSILRTIVNEDFLMTQHILDSPVVDVAFVLATNEAELLLLGRVVGLSKLVQGRVRCRAWVNIARRLLHSRRIVEQPGIARLSSLLLLLLVVVEADKLASVGAHHRSLDDGTTVVDQALTCTTNLAEHHL